jgi:prefoldin subunit 5
VSGYGATMDHEERADELEREVDKLEQHTEQVGKRIEDTRKEWESKEEDQQVPGAQSEEALHPEEEDENE